jgi:Flp pilus assembly protein TadB
VAEVVALVVLIVAMLAVVPWTVITAARARKRFGRPAHLQASRTDSKRVNASLKSGQVDPDPYVQELTENEARRAVWVAPTQLSFFAVTLAFYLALAFIVPAIIRWALALVLLCLLAGAAIQFTAWRRAKQYLAPPAVNDGVPHAG